MLAISQVCVAERCSVSGASHSSNDMGVDLLFPTLLPEQNVQFTCSMNNAEQTEALATDI